ncbi:glycosyltransferase family 4 protein [Microbacterium sp. NPDC078428]|uniref:glycosyltransferase family 4 protein n=1 Tax=Microbacterium sp. NPDC078428 TaxID=3364190 RepID=UPI0037C9192F
MIAPPWFEVPPSLYGGTESVVASLIDGLASRGHHVALIASGRARTRASSFHRVYAQPPSDELGRSVPELFSAAEAARILAGMSVDIVHDHSLAGPLLARGRDTPTLVTMHGEAGGAIGDYFQSLRDTVGVVAISHSQRRQRPLNWVGVVHNAVDVSRFPFRERKDGYLLWLGRYCAEKGPDLAIDAARAAGRTIVLAGKRRDPLEHRYFDEVIRPRLGPDTEVVGEVGGSQKTEMLAAASALLFPIRWAEPFGMVMIEAMATGTPVIALRRGSVPEIVDHGRTGYVLDDISGFPAAIDALEHLRPVDARRRVEQHFDVSVMTRAYERLYRRVLARSAKGTRALPRGRAQLRRISTA